MKIPLLLAFTLLTAATFAHAARTVPATFYVDSEKGSDTAEGSTETSAWRSLDRVNTAELIPGDSVLFKRGGLWRGTFTPHSGTKDARIVYSAYGTGAKPILQGSIARSKPDEWTEVRPGLWATLPFEPKILEQIMDLTDSRWSPSFQEGAQGTLGRKLENGRWFNRLTCQTSGKERHQIQVWGPQVKELAPGLMLRLRVRSTIPFKMDSVEAMRNHPPWTLATRGSIRNKVIGPEWQTLDVLLLKQEPMESAYLHFSLGGMVPSGAVFDFEPLSLWRASVEHCDPICFDVGIVILNHGEKWGVKKWSVEDLSSPLDYWYDAEGKRVFIASDANPATRFTSVELALTRHIVNQGGRHDITYDGLAVRYGGAHGFGGGSTKRITIRNCDVYWIGGGLQFFYPNGRAVRYGNGIEFWGGAEDHLVERNRLWEIYDAALTNQGNGKDSDQINITYRDNVIWNAEYSFEFWNRPKTTKTDTIVFEHNTCVDAGSCWSHAQRPDRNGGHLMFYQNSSETKNVVVRNNIFAGSTEVCMRMENDWRAGQTLSNNLYFQADKPVIRWLSKTFYGPADFARYQSELGMDKASALASPLFVDPAARDYRLKPGSPGATLATDGGPVGARLEAHN
jgi:hypothetical protein